MIRLLMTSLFSAPGPTRTAARHAVIDGLARRWGFRTYNAFLDWIVNEEQHLKQFQEFDSSLWRIPERRFTMSSLAAATAHLVGDTAECGVFEGATSYIICRARLHLPDHTHHCFDSFEGLSEPTPDDIVSDQLAYSWKKNDLAIPLARTKAMLAAFESRIQYHPGWIPDKFPEVQHRRFSLVHIDVDLYEPTAASLQFFYPRLVPGGMIVCDDYGFTTCPGARKACDEFCAQTPQRTVIHLTTGQGVILRQPLDA